MEISRTTLVSVLFQLMFFVIFAIFLVPVILMTIAYTKIGRVIYESVKDVKKMTHTK